METNQAKFIDRLRAAAEAHGAVAELLDLIESCLLLDDIGNRVVVGDDEDIELLKSAQIAAVFARLDRSDGDGDD